jgi:hypothetical protein
LAKLRQDPLLALFERYDREAGREERMLERAADEIALFIWRSAAC